MCNLYHLAPREHIETYFRTQVPDDYREVAVGPFNTGLFMRARPRKPADASDTTGTDNRSDTPMLAVMGQWGMVTPGSTTRRPASRAILTNNARAESIATRPTYRGAWRSGQRCLIPAAWYQEPNWETGKNIWWRLKRADGAPWALAGIWSEWADPATGELVPSYSMITINCDGHPMLGRLHKPDPKLPADSQDKRSVVALMPGDWSTWLSGDETQARALMTVPDEALFDQADVVRTNEALRAHGLL